MQNVLTPALNRTWEHRLSTEWALGCSGWFGSYALVACEVLGQYYLLTVGVVLVLVAFGLLAFFDKVFVQLLDLNDLVTLPARHKHGAFLPVVNVDRFSIKRRIVPVAERTHLLVAGTLRFRLDLGRGVLPWKGLLLRFCDTLLRSYVDLLVSLLLWWLVNTSFLESLFNLLQLRGSEPRLSKALAHGLSHHFEQLNDGFSRSSSHVLQLVLHALNRILERLIVHWGFHNQVRVAQDPS